MAENQQPSSRPALPLQALLVCAVATALFLHKAPLTTSRPQMVPLPTVGANADRVRVRLWQDPLDAAYREVEKRTKQAKSNVHRNNEAAMIHSVSQLAQHTASAANRTFAFETDSNSMWQFVRMKLESVLQQIVSWVNSCQDLRTKTVTDACVPPKTFENHLILPVMLRGGPYTDAAEDRMRTRFAVLSALAKVGYFPEHREHLAFLRLVNTNGVENRNGNLTQLRNDDFDHESLALPFESFEFSTLRADHPLHCELAASSTRDPATGPITKGKYFRVYVLWIDEDALVDPGHRLGNFFRPDQKLHKRIQKLLTAFIKLHLMNAYTESVLVRQQHWPNISSNGYKEYASTHHAKDDMLGINCDVRLLGPTSSDTLLQLCKGLPHPLLRDAPTNGFRAIYTPWATIEPKMLATLLAHDNDGASPIDPTCATSKGLGIIAQTSATDQQLFEVILAELRTRGVDFVNDIWPFANSGLDQTMVLVSEWDTLYGRAWRCAVLSSLEESRKEPTTIGICDCAKLERDYIDKLINDPSSVNVYFVSYVRGLDGQIPGSDEVDSIERTQSPSNFDALEFPAGHAQLDYIRRMEKSLDDLSNRLKKLDRRIAAIGVIGSDIYDKLLLFRSLEPRFDDVAFFTTDLDARLTHAEEYEYTHNVIVAASYGLQLHYKNQSPTLPFRDSHQTSLYTTILEILRLAGKEKVNLGQISMITDRERFDLTRSDLSPTSTSIKDKGVRIFEIGKNGPVCLNSTIESRAGSPPISSTVSDCSGIAHPLSDLLLFRDRLSPRAVLLFIIALLIAMLIAFTPIGLLVLSERELFERMRASIQIPVTHLISGGKNVWVLADGFGSKFSKLSNRWREIHEARRKQKPTVSKKWLNLVARSRWRLRLMGDRTAECLVLVIALVGTQVGRAVGILIWLLTPLYMLTLLLFGSIVVVLACTLLGLATPIAYAWSHWQHINLEPLALFLGIGVWGRSLILCVACFCGACFTVVIWCLRGVANTELRCTRENLQARLVGTNSKTWRSTLHKQVSELRPYRLIITALGITALLYTVGFLLSYYPHFRRSLARGQCAYYIDYMMQCLSTIWAVWVFSQVWCVAMRCFCFTRSLNEDALITQMTQGNSGAERGQYQDASLDLEHPNMKVLRDAAADGLIRIQAIAIESRLASRCTFMPFVLLLILIVARQPIFEEWAWPPGLIYFLFTMAATTMILIFASRHSAKKVRDRFTRFLGSQIGLLELHSHGDPASGEKGLTPLRNRTLAALEHAKQSILSMRAGAFSPAIESPLLSALLIPAGGLGLWEVILNLFGISNGGIL